MTTGMTTARWLAARTFLSLHLLLQRRAALVLAADGLFVLGVLVVALLEGEWSGFWIGVVAPYVVVAGPLLADGLALERRAGCLDLALSSPGSSFYFERRALVLGGVVFLQGLLLIVFARLFVQEFLLAPAILRAVTADAFMLSAVLFWTTRLQTAGAVSVASVATAVLFAPWLGAFPIHKDYVGLVESPSALLAAFAPDLVLGAASLVLYAYARRRLARPESLLRSGGRA